MWSTWFRENQVKRGLFRHRYFLIRFFVSMPGRLKVEEFYLRNFIFKKPDSINTVWIIGTKGPQKIFRFMQGFMRYSSWALLVQDRREIVKNTYVVNCFWYAYSHVKIFIIIFSHLKKNSKQKKLCTSYSGVSIRGHQRWSGMTGQQGKRQAIWKILLLESNSRPVSQDGEQSSEKILPSLF